MLGRQVSDAVWALVGGDKDSSSNGFLLSSFYHGLYDGGSFQLIPRERAEDDGTELDVEFRIMALDKKDWRLAHTFAPLHPGDPEPAAESLLASGRVFRFKTSSPTDVPLPNASLIRVRNAIYAAIASTGNLPKKTVGIRSDAAGGGSTKRGADSTAGRSADPPPKRQRKGLNEHADGAGSSSAAGGTGTGSTVYGVADGAGFVVPYWGGADYESSSESDHDDDDESADIRMLQFLSDKYSIDADTGKLEPAPASPVGGMTVSEGTAPSASLASSSSSATLCPSKVVSLVLGPARMLACVQAYPLPSLPSVNPPPNRACRGPGLPAKKFT